MSISPVSSNVINEPVSRPQGESLGTYTQGKSCLCCIINLNTYPCSIIIIHTWTQSQGTFSVTKHLYVLCLTISVLTQRGILRTNLGIGGLGVLQWHKHLYRKFVHWFKVTLVVLHEIRLFYHGNIVFL